MSCPEAPSVACYALGTLEPAEQADVAAHLAVCADCRQDLDRFAGLPALLARVEPADLAGALAGGDDAPDELGFRRLLAAARDHQRTGAPEDASRRRDRRARRLLAAAAAVVVLAGGAGATVALWPGTPAPRTVSASAGSVHAWVSLLPTATGTRLQLRLTGVPPDTHCRLVAVARDGHHEVAGSWEATYTGTASIDGTTGVPVGELARLEVQTMQGRPLVVVPVAG